MALYADCLVLSFKYCKQDQSIKAIVTVGLSCLYINTGGYADRSVAACRSLPFLPLFLFLLSFPSHFPILFSFFTYFSSVFPLSSLPYSSCPIRQLFSSSNYFLIALVKMFNYEYPFLFFGAAVRAFSLACPADYCFITHCIYCHFWQINGNVNVDYIIISTACVAYSPTKKRLQEQIAARSRRLHWWSPSREPSLGRWRDIVTQTQDSECASHVSYMFTSTHVSGLLYLRMTAFVEQTL